MEQKKQKHLNKATINSKVATSKVTGLTELQSDLRAKSSLIKPQDFIASHAQEPIYNQHRLFKKGNTRTKDFLDNLPTQIGLESPSLAGG